MSSMSRLIVLNPGSGWVTGFGRQQEPAGVRQRACLARCKLRNQGEYAGRVPRQSPVNGEPPCRGSDMKALPAPVRRQGAAGCRSDVPLLNEAPPPVEVERRGMDHVLSNFCVGACDTGGAAGMTIHRIIAGCPRRCRLGFAGKEKLILRPAAWSPAWQISATP